jgi:hypothetical protein
MRKEMMPHLVVVLPGISGSVLSKDGRDVWAPTAGALWRGLTSLGGTLQSLALGADDWQVDDLGDGISAPRLVEEVTIIPGLYKTAGYSSLVGALRERFQLIDVPNDGRGAGNFLPFPYDWRRDNRATARRLQSVINEALPRWRTESNNPKAQVVLIAHSMGGLISRYYLECLDGWKDCLALVTFGTPFRGSPSALGYLANGYKQAFVDVTDVLRSCTSVYQLVPIYEMLQIDGAWRRVAEVDRPLPGVDPRRAVEALAFHREIETAVNAHRNDEEYTQRGYKMLPFVGVYQPTLQSAILSGSQVSVGNDLPGIVPSQLDAGDGTVPRCSATPIELGNEFRETYEPERHGMLQTNPRILDDILNRLTQFIAADSHAQIRGSGPRTESNGLALSVDDLYVHGEPGVLSIRGVNCEPATITVVITNFETNATIAPPVVRANAGWTVGVDQLPPGTYQVTIHAYGGTAPSVHDIFVVVPT